MNYALIFAGGAGCRMSARSKPKQFLQLYGKEIIVHTIENFQNHKDIDGIVVVCIESWIPYFNQLVQKFNLSKVLKVVKGGATGQDSIYQGLEALHVIDMDSNAVVLIHDGVRPFVNDDLISLCIQSVKERGSAITVVPAIETIVGATDGEICQITDRSKCFMAKAPQCFKLNNIYEKHQCARIEHKHDFIDSASLMHYYGEKLYTVIGNFDNIKITTPADFYTFRALYDVRENQQIFGI